MKTIIQLWNPELERPSDLDEQLETIQSGKIAEFGDWSTAATKDVPSGSRFFMFRKGVEPKGIFAAGHTVGTPEEEYRNQNWVEIEFTSMLDVEEGQKPLSIKELLRDSILRDVRWDRLQSNGKILTSAQASRLEVLWKKRLERYDLEELA
jgi:hypothetical protein